MLVGKNGFTWEKRKKKKKKKKKKKRRRYHFKSNKSLRPQYFHNIVLVANRKWYTIK